MPVTLHMALLRTLHAQKKKIRPGMTQIGLSPGQPKVLIYVSRHSCCMQRDIADAFDIEPATVSQILNNMEQAGLVKRSGSAERKRADSVSITEKGRNAYEKWKLLCREVEEDSFKGFSKEEEDRFLDCLCRMYRNLTGKTLE